MKFIPSALMSEPVCQDTVSGFAMVERSSEIYITEIYASV